VQALAAWLVSRPQNAVLGLAVTLLLPAPQLTSGVIMVLLVLAQGARLAVIEASVAAAALMAVSLVFGVSLASLMALVTGTWLPVTMQVSVILAVIAMAGFYIVVTDPVAFWQPYLTLMAEIARQNSLELNTELLNAEVMTVSATLAFWMLYIAGLLLGYGLYKKLPAKTSEYGWFRNLSFGRVIAFTMALVSLLAFVVDAAWLSNLAFVMFAVFWIQGLAIVHWMHAEGMLPLAAVVAIYVLLPLLQVLLVTALAVFGYLDAWFEFRRRLKKA
jgi:hypothetical protein